VSAGPVLAADVGGTQMRAALVDHGGDIVLRRAATTPGDADVPVALIDLIRSVAADSAHRPASHAVIGLPGAVDYGAGRLLWAPHLPERWPDLLACSALSSQIAMPVHIANDADLAAVGEAAFGAGAGSPDVAYLTVSTGIGAGIVHGGRLLHGTRSLAEVGHTVIDWRAWLDGGPSTLEELASGSGIAERAREAGLGARDAADVAAAAAAGDARADAIWRGAIAACAAGVSSLLMTFYPSTLVIGGGLGREDGFFGAVRDLVHSRPGHHPAELTIVRSLLGDDAGLAGAAAWGAALGSP
jgi:glucokinase